MHYATRYSQAVSGHTQETTGEVLSELACDIAALLLVHEVATDYSADDELAALTVKVANIMADVEDADAEVRQMLQSTREARGVRNGDV